MRPVVMIAHAGPDREVALAEGAGETAVAVRVTPVGQVAGRQQQIGPVGTVIQGAQDLVQPLAVEFGGVVRVEAQMDVRDLRDQHWSLLPSYISRPVLRSEEHTSELQSLMRISYAVFCLKKKNIQINHIY